MKKLIILVLFSIFVFTIFANPLPSYWTRYDQMKATMDSLALAYPNLIKVDSLGASDTENIPIWGAKLSSNVHERRDVPRLLIIGSLHAEEVIGNEIVMKFLKDMVINSNQAPFNNWMNELETWLVPNMNPEGLAVVMSGMDTSFRKNKRDNNNNGIFDFLPGTGGDIDGVDLNRNWDVNWVHGDTLYSTSGYELYDYYRGEYPFSEGENRAIRDLAYREQFTYAIIWHSSRTGNLSEKVFIPYDFKNLRKCPDWDINNMVGTGVATNILKQGGTAHYEPLAASGRKGDQHVWFYSTFGTIMLLIEAGTSDLQPSYPILVDTVNRCSNGMYWMFNRATPTGADGITRSMLTGHVRDAVTGEPLVAEVIVHGRYSEALAPRLSNAEHGRFWRPLPQGSCTFSVRKKGYVPDTLTVNINPSGWRYREINLQPLPAITINLSVKSNGNPVSATVFISDPTGDDKYTTNNGFVAIDTFTGTRVLTIITDNGVPWQQELELTNSVNMSVDVSVANVLFSDDFNSDLSQWEVDGPWVIVNHDNRTFVTDSWGGYGFYAPGCDVSIISQNPVSIPANQETYLLFDQHLYTEWEHDFVTVSVSNNKENWHELYRKAGRYDWWHKNLINLSDFAGQELFFRFRLQDDITNNSNIYDLTDPGWSIDNLKILTGNTVSNEDIFMEKPFVSLNQNYPNPFNPETKISFNIQNMTVNTAYIDIFNVKGQKVQRLDIADEDVKNSFVVWNAEKLSSGVYFYRLQVNNEIVSVKKALLLK